LLKVFSAGATVYSVTCWWCRQW